jgi:O-antigen/teichoic acid export membrane protein
MGSGGTGTSSLPGHATAFRRSLAQGGTTWMLAGSLIAALGAYLFQVLGARSLGEVEYAPIGVLWTLQYLLTSIVMAALESWVVRTTTSSAGSTATLRAVAPRLVAAVAGVAIGMLAVVYAGQELLLPDNPGLVLVVPLLVVFYSAFATVRGVLAARQRFKAYGGVTALESVSRLVAAGVVALTVPSAALLALTMPLGALVAASWGVAVRRRGSTAPPADVPDGPVPVPVPAAAPGSEAGPGRFLGITGTANAAAQLLLAGGPLVLGALGGTPRDISVLFVTVTAARVPLVIVQGGLLSRLLPTFTRMADTGARTQLTRTGLRMLGASAVLSLLGGVFGWFLGPALVSLLFGSGFRPDSLTTASVAVGMVLATGAILTNQILIALRLETRLLVVWWGALAVATAVVLLSGGLTATERVLAAFTVGEVTATAILAAALVVRSQAASVPRVTRTSGLTS